MESKKNQQQEKIIRKIEGSNQLAKYNATPAVDQCIGKWTKVVRHGKSGKYGENGSE